MAKGQKRSNRETKKPKQKKAVLAAPATFEKGLSTPIGAAKQKNSASAGKGQGHG